MPKGMKGFQRGALNPSRTKEGRKRISEWRIANPVSTETRELMQERSRIAVRRPEVRKKRAELAKGRWKSVATRKKMAASGRKRPKKIRSTMRYADSAFSKYIRLKYADESGMVRCFTCDGLKQITETDCGHFVGRMHKSLRYDERNSHPQCQYCNRYLEGAKDVYALRLMERYGQDILVVLNAEKRRVVHMGAEDYLEIARSYKAKAKELIAERTGFVGYSPFLDKDLPVGDVEVAPSPEETLS